MNSISIKRSSNPSPHFLLTVAIFFVIIAFPVFSQSPFSEDPVTVNKANSTLPTPATEISADSGELAEVIALNSPENISLCISHYHPVGDWTGSLILPRSIHRDSEGSVFIRITNSPEKDKIGKILRLVRSPLDELDLWVNKFRPDVNMDPKKAESARKKGDAIPVFLNGWKKVSNLESLAAARPGEMDVLLPYPEISDNRLIIKEDPVQISGSHKALVKFVGPALGKYRKIVHYGSGNFNGPTEYVGIPPEFFRRKNDAVPMTSTIDIENSSSNKDGWYIYGKRDGNVFNVEALEPRAALRVGKAKQISGESEIKEFLLKTALKDLKPDIFRHTILNGKTGNNSWKPGTRAMVAHVFGWRKSPDEKNSGIVLGLVTGHFAFGRAEIVECPFTGEPRWDIDYFQIYVHNPNKIISCTQKWNAYMGNLRRGWLFTVPVADTMIMLPENGLVSIGEKKIDMYRVMRNEFERMMAVYRTGAGTGLTSVRSDVSCVQDSHAALWASFRRLEDIFSRFDNGQAAKTIELIKTQIGRLVKDVERNITFHGIASGKWKEFYDKPDAIRYSNVFTILWDSMLSAGTIFPRNANDRIIEMFAEHGLPMYQVLVCQMGGLIKNLTPVAPTSPRRK